jgi:hypothetical protein
MVKHSATKYAKHPMSLGVLHGTAKGVPSSEGAADGGTYVYPTQSPIGIRQAAHHSMMFSSHSQITFSSTCVMQSEQF